MENKDYVIFKRNVANELLENGFKLKSIQPNYSDDRKSVFMFECTQELIEYVEKIKNKK